MKNDNKENKLKTIINNLEKQLSNTESELMKYKETEIILKKEIFGIKKNNSTNREKGIMNLKSAVTKVLENSGKNTSYLTDSKKENNDNNLNERINTVHSIKTNNNFNEVKQNLYLIILIINN